MMKKIFTRRVFAIVCLLAAMGIITSCEKEDTSKTSAIELLSFGPAGVKHGEDISLIGNNLDKVTAVEFTGATVSKEQFKQQSSELIVLTVPSEAVRGKVILCQKR
jgi:major membrane immunogen (membrane-anchored lipoprotein)